MKRNKFLILAGGTVLVVGAGGYLMSDTKNFKRNDLKADTSVNSPLTADEKEILYLASLAPSGHNTQPWFVQYIEPYHWIIGNDKTKWLPAVDPTQRETILSIGAFMQNLEYAAQNLGYSCQFDLMATHNQDENLVTVKLEKTGIIYPFDSQKIAQRRTVRSNFLSNSLQKDDLSYLTREESEFFHFIPNTSKAYKILNEQTIEANKIQAYRDAAQAELAEWIRFSSKDAENYADGLTTAGMEIEGFAGWIVRNFYGKANVMKKDFRDKNIDNVRKEVSQSAGWLLISSKGDSVSTLLETGQRMQRLWLKVRDKNIAIHPMTQILEEPATNKALNSSIGISDNIQFILRMGYLKKYPEPVSLRRSVDRFLRI
jgi:hypothetical protein